MGDKEFFDIDFFKIRSNNVAPRRGRVLIADPFASDFFFTRSVVLLTEYDQRKGAMGFILNKPMARENYPSEIFEALGEEFSPRVYYGGPVGKTQMFYIHQLPPSVLEGSEEIIPNLYWGGNFEELAKLIKQGAVSLDNVKFYIGYSGWAPGQLEGEIQRNFWVIDDVSVEEVLGDTSDLWKTKLKELGPRYEVWTRYPTNPEYN